MIDPTEPIDAEVDSAADILQREFGRLKTAQMGRKYHPAERFKRRELWLSVAKKCVELQADPYDFLRAAFRHCLVNGGPFPQQLATNASAKWYEIYKKTVGQSGAFTLYTDEVRSIIINAVNNLTAMCQGQGRTSQSILLDENFLPLYVAPPYIRVLLLSTDPLILEKYGRDARLEILGDARLGKALKDLGWSLNWMDVVKQHD